MTGSVSRFNDSEDQTRTRHDLGQTYRLRASFIPSVLNPTSSDAHATSPPLAPASRRAYGRTGRTAPAAVPRLHSRSPDGARNAVRRGAPRDTSFRPGNVQT